MKASTRLILNLSVALSLGAFGFSGIVLAQDLSDNETCLECHADMPREAPEDSDRPRIHTDEGGFTVEAHEMWSCIDCHESITEIPHPDEALGSEVNCLNCHEEMPTTQ